jgi:MFS family permease
MVSLGAGPMYVALTQTASTLPFFVFALPAGSIGDIVDRRRLILYTEAWMLCVAITLAAATLTGIVTPWLLLALTFALSTGDAVETPTWRAVLPELVRREDLPAASALNGIEFNIARAIGPALAGALIAVAGGAIGYGVLLGCFGAGAVAGALVMQAARARWGTVGSRASVDTALLWAERQGTQAFLSHETIEISCLRMPFAIQWITCLSGASGLAEAVV